MSVTKEEYMRTTTCLMKQLAAPYRYKVKRVVDRIYIFTKCEEWYFVPKQGGKVKLMHRNAKGHSSKEINNYHVQFKKYMSYANVMRYVHSHEVYKYGVRRIPPEVAEGLMDEF